MSHPCQVLRQREEMSHQAHKPPINSMQITPHTLHIKYINHLLTACKSSPSPFKSRTVTRTQNMISGNRQHQNTENFIVVRQIVFLDRTAERTVALHQQHFPNSLQQSFSLILPPHPLHTHPPSQILIYARVHSQQTHSSINIKMGSGDITSPRPVIMICLPCTTLQNTPGANRVGDTMLPSSNKQTSLPPTNLDPTVWVTRCYHHPINLQVCHPTHLEPTSCGHRALSSNDQPTLPTCLKPTMSPTQLSNDQPTLPTCLEPTTWVTQFSNDLLTLQTRTLSAKSFSEICTWSCVAP